MKALFNRSLPAPFASFDDIDQFELGGSVVHVNRRTSSLFVAKNTLWKIPRLDEGSLAQFPTDIPESGGGKRLQSLLSTLDIPSTDGISIRPDAGWSAGTRLVIWTRATGARSVRTLDTTDSLTLTLNASKFDLSGIPVTGPGVALTYRKDVRSDNWLGLSLGIPIVGGVYGEFPVIARPDADERLRSEHVVDDDVLYDAVLTYRVVDAGGAQYLAPFWAYDIVFNGVNGYVSGGVRLVPAVDADFKAHCRADQPFKVVRPAASVVDWGPDETKLRFLLSWLGMEVAQLSCSETAMKSAVDVLTQAGWVCRDFGDVDCAERDWAGEGSAVTQADLAAYIGHSAAYGFQFRSPKDDWLSDFECSFGGRLKWVLSDSCGPLHDEVAGRGSTTFRNWGNSFKGLRALLGFATSQVLNTEQLPRTLKYALSGQPLARAWFQAACEVQGTETTRRRPAWAAGLFAVNGDDTTIEDKLTDTTHAPAVTSDPAQLAGLWVPIG